MLPFKENFSVPGKWGYPGTPDNEWVFGELSYDRDNGIKLQLQGALRKLEHSLDLRLNLVIPALTGETQNHYYSLFELEGYEEGNSSWTITTLEARFLLQHKQWLINAEAAITGMSFGSGFFFPFFRGSLPPLN